MKSVKGDTKSEPRKVGEETHVKSINGKVAVSRLKDTTHSKKCAMIRPVWISHKDNPNSEILSYAL